MTGIDFAFKWDPDWWWLRSLTISKKSRIGRSGQKSSKKLKKSQPCSSDWGSPSPSWPSNLFIFRCASISCFQVVSKLLSYRYFFRSSVYSCYSLFSLYSLNTLQSLQSLQSPQSPQSRWVHCLHESQSLQSLQSLQSPQSIQVLLAHLRVNFWTFFGGLFTTLTFTTPNS